MDFTSMPNSELVDSKPVLDDEINWDEEPSSPFVTQLAGDASVLGRRCSAASPEITERFSLSPSSQLKMESNATPFQICEDETCTPNNIVTPQPSPSKTVKAGRRTPSVVDTTELLDNTVLTSEDANIDDTCFSAFSEIPNMDMTRFAQMRLSPSKQSALQDQVCRSDCVLCKNS
jgi:hypothetical protein